MFALSACDENSLDLGIPVKEITFAEKVYSVASDATSLPTLTPTILPENATDKTVIWSSSREDIISVDPKSGKLTRTSKKIYATTAVTITATALSGVTGTVQLTVGDGEFDPIETITLSAEQTTVWTCDTALPKINATWTPETVKDATITWLSSWPGYLAVDPVTGELSIGPEAGNITVPTDVTIVATAGEIARGTIDFTVRPASFTFQGEDQKYVYNVNYSAGHHEYQPQGACHNNCHLFWWNMKGQAGVPDKNIPAVDDPLGNWLTVTVLNSNVGPATKIGFYFLGFGDFGTFDIYINDKKIASNVNTCGNGGTHPFGPFDAEIPEGEFTLKFVAVAYADVANACMLGLDEITIYRQ